MDEVVRQFGEAGAKWLDGLPQTLQQLSEQWGLELDAPFTGGLAVNLVIPCRRGDEQLVLKLGYPQSELLSEIALLERWQTLPGRVQLVSANRDNYAFLMQRVLPGTTFRQSTLTGRSIKIPDLFERVPVPATSRDEFPEYRQWCEQAFRQFALSPSKGIENFQADINQASIILETILASRDGAWLLHGDLHHENMVLGDNGNYLAIDPKGVKGPRILEYGRFIHNFIRDESTDSEKIIKLRLANLPAYPDDDLLGVAYLDLVLSLTWTFNSGGQCQEGALDTLACIAQMLR